MKSIDENKTIGFTIQSEYLDFRKCVSLRTASEAFSRVSILAFSGATTMLFNEKGNERRRRTRLLQAFQ